MNRAFSVYLDLIRFVAAFLVFVYHSNQRIIIEKPLPLSDYGHSSVIVFFVLSGYVISYVSSRNENDLFSFGVARFARVFSVAVPAVFLTCVLDLAGRSLYPEVYASYPIDNILVRIVSSIFMLNELWFVSITSFSNVPYWSITYEWWYYLIFGVANFLSGRLRVVTIGAVVLILGPKILLLLPIWYLGVFLHRSKLGEDLKLFEGIVMVLLSVLLITLLRVMELQEATTGLLENLLGSEVYKYLTFSKFFLTDYLLAIAVALNFAGMKAVLLRVDLDQNGLVRIVRFCASYTFSLYLLHQPLFLFWAAVVNGDPSGSMFWWQVTVLVFLSVVLIGSWTEKKKDWLKTVSVRALSSFNRAAKAREEFL